MQLSQAILVSPFPAVSTLYHAVPCLAFAPLPCLALLLFAPLPWLLAFFSLLCPTQIDVAGKKKITYDEWVEFIESTEELDQASKHHLYALHLYRAIVTVNTWRELWRGHATWHVAYL
jgi:hypothetical protein